MPKFVELWVYLSATPLFGLTATLVVYVLAQAAYARLGQAPWANPVLWTVLTIASVLLVTGETGRVGAPKRREVRDFFQFLLTSSAATKKTTRPRTLPVAFQTPIQVDEYLKVSRDEIYDEI